MQLLSALPVFSSIALALPTYLAESPSTTYDRAGPAPALNDARKTPFYSPLSNSHSLHSPLSYGPSIYYPDNKSPPLDSPPVTSPHFYTSRSKGSSSCRSPTAKDFSFPHLKDLDKVLPDLPADPLTWRNPDGELQHLSLGPELPIFNSIVKKYDRFIDHGRPHKEPSPSIDSREKAAFIESLEKERLEAQNMQVKAEKRRDEAEERRIVAEKRKFDSERRVAELKSSITKKQDRSTGPALPRKASGPRTEDEKLADLQNLMKAEKFIRAEDLRAETIKFQELQAELEKLRVEAEKRKILAERRKAEVQALEAGLETRIAKFEGNARRNAEFEELKRRRNGFKERASYLIDFQLSKFVPRRVESMNYDHLKKLHSAYIFRRRLRKFEHDLRKLFTRLSDVNAEVSATARTYTRLLINRCNELLRNDGIAHLNQMGTARAVRLQAASRIFTLWWHLRERTMFRVTY